MIHSAGQSADHGCVCGRRYVTSSSFPLFSLSLISTWQLYRWERRALFLSTHRTFYCRNTTISTHNDTISTSLSCSLLSKIYLTLPSIEHTQYFFHLKLFLLGFFSILFHTLVQQIKILKVQVQQTEKGHEALKYSRLCMCLWEESVTNSPWFPTQPNRQYKFSNLLGFNISVEASPKTFFMVLVTQTHTLTQSVLLVHW